ncbi:MAG: hypothetical protein WAW41_05350 [Methylobacter sp.]
MQKQPFRRSLMIFHAIQALAGMSTLQNDHPVKMHAMREASRPYISRGKGGKQPREHGHKHMAAVRVARKARNKRK